MAHKRCANLNVCTSATAHTQHVIVNCYIPSSYQVQGGNFKKKKNPPHKMI